MRSTATATALGPVHIRFALTRTAEDRFIFDASETDDQTPGPVNYLMNKRRARHRLRPVFPRRRPRAGVQCRRRPRLRRDHPARGLAPAPALPRAARHARHDHDARAGRAERADQCGRHARHRRRMRPTSSCWCAGSAEGQAFPAVGRARRRLRRRGRTRTGIDAVYFVAQENYPVEFLELAYPVRLNTYAIHRDSGGPGAYPRRLRHHPRSSKSSPMTASWRSASIQRG